MGLSENKKRQIIDAFQSYVKNHPQPDRPVIQVGDKKYSPRQLLEEMKNETALGKRWLIAAYEAGYTSDEKVYLPEE